MRVGDVVEGYGVNTAYRGTVVKLERDRRLKPFVIMTRMGERDAGTWFSHREYIQKRKGA